VLYTEGELAMALSHYEDFHRLLIGSATVEHLQRSSAKIGGWLAAAEKAAAEKAEVQPSLTKTFSVEVALESWRKMHEWFAEKTEKATAEKAAAEKAAALQRFDGDAP
jgi:hypothetical protein